MKITDRRGSPRSWLDVDEYGLWWHDWPTRGQASMTVDATDDREPTGLLDAQGRPLFRVRRGPGFGIW